MRIITRAVWILSLVSLFTDVASEMLYPVVPVYLRDIGFSVLLIGVLEGLAEFVVGLSKGYFGHWSDRIGLRIPFVKLGYALSAIAKPMMALFSYPAWIFLARSTDRMGKGIRTAARDALLAQETVPATRARVFSFHRAWDTTGAILGPLLALLWLYFYPGAYRKLFFLALVPGLVSVALVFLLREKKQVGPARSPGFFSYFKYWNHASPEYRRLLTGLFLFALANSSDMFLLLRSKAISGSDTFTVSAYVFYNLIYALAAYPMGILADRFGMKRILLSGILLFALVYLGFGWAAANWQVLGLFVIYGIYAASTEGVSKAWILQTLKDTHTGTAIGLFASGQSICGLAASVLAGVIWSLAGAPVLFWFSAGLSVLAAVYLARLPAHPAR